MSPLFLAMPGNEAMTARLAAAVGGDIGACEVGSFPDGEAHVRVAANPQGRSVALVCTLSHPDDKFLRLVFAADTLRELGANRVGLVAPYLAYMRQDRRFHPGEAVTSAIFARLISRSFDWLATVDPHLHRHKSLEEIYSIPCLALHAGSAIAEWIERNIERPFLIGPDGESRQWVAAVAAACGADYSILEKRRLGDRSVTVDASRIQIPPQTTPVLIDDIVSSGATMIEAMAAVRQKTPASAVSIAVHMLGDPSLATALEKTGVRLVTTNTIPWESGLIDITPILVTGLGALIS